MNIDQLNKGIWIILTNFKSPNLDLTSKGFKQFFTVMQLIENLKNIDTFCFKYTVIEGCSNPNCTKTLIKSEYFSPSININEEYWIQYSIPNLLDYFFRNINTHCVKCQWSNGIVDVNSTPKYFKNIIKIIAPSFLFVSFEDNLNENFEEYMKNNVKISEENLNSLLYDKLKNNLNYIKIILTDEFVYLDNKYILRGLILMPSNDHYTALLINVKNEQFLIEKGKCYYYNDAINNNEIIAIDNWRTILEKEVPVLAFYQKSLMN